MLSSSTLTDIERLNRLRLIRSENVGPVTFHRLLRRFGTAEAALSALPDLARRGGRRSALTLCSEESAAREMQACARAGFRMIMEDDALYPPYLRVLDDAPPILIAKGRLDFLTVPAVAIVGARNASVNGRIMARKIAADLGQRGVCVVSGMARGIDTAAHEGALPYATVAVLAGGADVIYPQENTALYDKIIHSGVILSEMPLGKAPQANLFPRRNRIVSGMACGVVVVEASLKSGSLITARLAGEQGREVFAVPGFPADPRSRGPNSLIRQGACLTENASDIMDVLHPMQLRPHLYEKTLPLFDVEPAETDSDDALLKKAREVLSKSLNSAPVSIDELIRQCQLSAAVVSVVLLELDLAGRIEHHPGNRVSQIADL